MSDNLVKFPDIKIDRKQMAMFRTPFPKWGEEDLKRVSGSFKFSLKDMKHVPPRYVFSNKKERLDIFRTSDSLRWFRFTDEMREPDKQVKFPDEKDAVLIAQDFIKERGLQEEEAKSISISYVEHSRIGKENKVLSDYPVEMHVNFGFMIEDLPIMGPGAKMKVKIGAQNSINEAFKFWRAGKKERDMELIPLEKAMEIIANDKAYAKLDKKTSKVEISDIKLGYYALPPRRKQLFLIPVYAFKGVASTKAFPNYEFVKNVIAVDIPRADAKCIGAPIGMSRDGIF